MDFDALLTAAVLLLGASAVTVALFHRAGFGTVLGLLATGIALGPYTPGPTVNIGPVAAAAELGVVFLLFLIGLELEPRRLWAMRKTLFGLGTLQVLVSGMVLAAPVLLMGRPWQAALILGLGLALSSTAFVLQLLAERNELGSEHGRTAFSILLLQDMAIVPLLALVPLLSPVPVETEVEPLWLRTLIILGTIGGTIALGMLLLPRAFAVVAKQRSGEAFAILAALAVVAAAWITHHAGLSPALGAFVMGVLLSRSPFHHQIDAELSPFKGVLLGLFFVSVGMSINVGLLAESWPRILVMVLALILMKALVIYGLCRLFGLGRVTSVRTALIMTQGGEFGFVLFAAAAATGLIGQELYTTALLVISVSMAATPFLDRMGASLARRLAAEQGRTPSRPVEPELDRHVIIAGFGRVGRTIAGMLDDLAIPYVAIDLDPIRVIEAQRRGCRIVYGDASERRLLERVGAGRAAIMLVTLDRPSAAERIVATVRSLYPGLAIHARAHDAEGSDRLARLGASLVLPETLELSLSLGSALLQQLGVPEDKTAEVARNVRRRHARQGN